MMNTDDAKLKRHRPGSRINPPALPDGPRRHKVRLP